MIFGYLLMYTSSCHLCRMNPWMPSIDVGILTNEFSKNYSDVLNSFTVMIVRSDRLKVTSQFHDKLENLNLLPLKHNFREGFGRKVSSKDLVLFWPDFYNSWIINLNAFISLFVSQKSMFQINIPSMISLRIHLRCFHIYATNLNGRRLSETSACTK